MKKLAIVLLIILGITPIAISQNSRWDYAATTTNTLSGNLIPLFVIPNAPVSFYTGCTALPCTTKANVYPSISSTSACPADQQVVLPLENVCKPKADIQGNFGGWFVPGQYQYTVTTFGVVNGPFPFTVGGVGGGGGGSGCVPSGGGPYPTVPFGFGEVVQLTNAGTGCSSSGNIVSDGGTMLFQNDANIMLTAPSPRDNDEYSLIQPDFWKLQSSTGSGGQPGIHMEIDDGDAALGGGAGGGTPIFIAGTALKNDPTSSWEMIDLLPGIAGTDKSITDFTNIAIEHPLGFAKVRNYYGLRVQMDGSRATNEEAAVLVDTNSSAITSNYCDFLAKDPGVGVREALGCGTTHTSTFGGTVTVPELDVAGSGTSFMRVQQGPGTGCPTPASGYDIFCANATAGGMQLSNNGGAYFTLGSGGGGITLTTLGSSGPSTLVGSTLNVPVYSSGGGGSAVYPFTGLTAPNISSWTWQNQGSATASTSSGALLINNVGNGADNIHFIGDTLPATPWTVVACLVPGSGPGFPTYQIQWNNALTLTDGTKYTTFNAGVNSTASLFNFIGVTQYTNATTFSATSYTANPTMWPTLLCYRIQDNGTTRTYSMAPDATRNQWTQVFSEAHAGFLTPTKAGISANYFFTSNTFIGYGWVSYNVTTP